MNRVKTGSRVIIDGLGGRVILDPDRETLEKYEKLQARHLEQERRLLALKDLRSVTVDGKLIDIAANIELPSEISAVLDHGCKNIGLCRTEFLFMLKNKPPTEEEQYATYRNYLEKMKPGYVIIRTLDIGGDKLALPGLHDNTEANPAMGLRAIRLCLAERDLFRTQLRAILRASVHGNLKIMFPMITSLEELRAALEFYRGVKKELLDAGVPVSPSIDVGIMIEVPAAALAAETLAREVDFFSIGTNDLAQFMLAVDRGNKKLAPMFDPLHPSLLNTIKHVVDSAHRCGIWVGVCGEMAGDPLSSLLLLGMGVDELSMNSTSVLEIKKIIRSITFDEMRGLVKQVLTLETSRQIRLFLQREFRRKVLLSRKLRFLPQA
jgi:phosphotransferase system enzyme I (PtsI)